MFKSIPSLASEPYNSRMYFGRSRSVSSGVASRLPLELGDDIDDDEDEDELKQVNFAVELNEARGEAGEWQRQADQRWD
jgi:hypothetical protein